jgi:hypothetical protein
VDEQKSRDIAASPAYDLWAELSSHGHLVEIPACVSSVWGNDYAFRVRNQLFFCGQVFDIEGNRRGHVDGSALAERLHSDQQTSRAPALLGPQWASIIRDEAVFVTQMLPMKPINELRIASQSLSGGSEVNVTNIALAPSSPGYRVVGARLAYSPEKLLLAPFDANERSSLLCRAE